MVRINILKYVVVDPKDVSYIIGDKMEIKKFKDESQNVTKYVFTDDDVCYEAVLYRYPTYEERTVLCISTQCGCPVGCTFCGTGKQFVRNLSIEEIANQVYEVFGDIKISTTLNGEVTQLIFPKKLQIMFMSMGEPFLNFFCTMGAAIEIAESFPSADLLFSTIGPRMEKELSSFIGISKITPKIGLQFSIHESSDYQRNRLIPFKNKLTLREIRDYGIEWYAATGRKVFLNYCINGRNNYEDDANRLFYLFSPTAFAFTFSVICSSDETMSDAAYRNMEIIEEFEDKFIKLGYDTRIFDPAGQDSIGGGCGQLWYVQKWMKEQMK